MPLFMDHHRGVEGLTAEAVADAHKKDLEIQDEHGVKYHQYWFNEETGEEDVRGRGVPPMPPKSNAPREERHR